MCQLRDGIRLPPTNVAEEVMWITDGGFQEVPLK